MHAFTVDLILDSSKLIVLECSLTTVDNKDESCQDQASDNHSHTDLLESIEEYLHFSNSIAKMMKKIYLKYSGGSNYNKVLDIE